MVANPRVVYAKLTGTGLPVSGEHLILDKSRSIDLENVPLNGGYLTKTIILRYVAIAMSFSLTFGISDVLYTALNLTYVNACEI